jgi:hypothetical protein
MDDSAQRLNPTLFLCDLFQRRYSASDSETEPGSRCLLNLDVFNFHFSV